MSRGESLRRFSTDTLVPRHDLARNQDPKGGPPLPSRDRLVTLVLGAKKGVGTLPQFPLDSLRRNTLWI